MKIFEWFKTLWEDDRTLSASRRRLPGHIPGPPSKPNHLSAKFKRFTVASPPSIPGNLRADFQGFEV